MIKAVKDHTINNEDSGVGLCWIAFSDVLAYNVTVTGQTLEIGYQLTPVGIFEKQLSISIED